jgi:hypothetical protein
MNAHTPDPRRHDPVRPGPVEGRAAGPKGLLATQWRQYSTAHRDRPNLLVHAVTAPVFLAGSCALVASPWTATGAWKLAVAGAGVLAMMLAIAAQGRTHRREESAPAPFRGPGDVAARLLAEQWVTFPRYVLTGAFARAWRAARETTGAAAGEPR